MAGHIGICIRYLGQYISIENPSILPNAYIYLGRYGHVITYERSHIHAQLIFCAMWCLHATKTTSGFA